MFSFLYNIQVLKADGSTVQIHQHVDLGHWTLFRDLELKHLLRFWLVLEFSVCLYFVKNSDSSQLCGYWLILKSSVFGHLLSDHFSLTSGRQGMWTHTIACYSCSYTWCVSDWIILTNFSQFSTLCISALKEILIESTTSFDNFSTLFPGTAHI